MFIAIFLKCGIKNFLLNTVGRLSKPEDVANLVAFICSPLSGYINGADYRIDCGSITCILIIYKVHEANFALPR